MLKSPKGLLGLVVAVALTLGSFMAQAAEKSFASTKVVLQISDPNPFKQTLVLNVASNVIKHYGEDNVQVEIVAFGPGLRLLQEGNVNTSRIDGLASKGVRFSACANTQKAMSKKLGHMPVMNSNAVTVGAGVVRIIDLIKEGYFLIKP